MKVKITIEERGRTIPNVGDPWTIMDPTGLPGRVYIRIPNEYGERAYQQSPNAQIIYGVDLDSGNLFWSNINATGLRALTLKTTELVFV